MTISSVVFTSSISNDDNLSNYFKLKEKKTLKKITKQIQNLPEISKQMPFDAKEEPNYENKNIYEATQVFRKAIEPSIIVPAINTPKTKLNNIFPLILNKTDKTSSEKIEYSYKKSQEGICSGTSHWFAHLLFSIIQSKGHLEEKDIVGLSKHFEFGAGKVPTIIQAIPSEFRPSFEFNKNGITVTNFIDSNDFDFDYLPLGIYFYTISTFFPSHRSPDTDFDHIGHMCILIKLSDKVCFLFDPTQGLIKINTDSAAKAILSHAKFYYNFVKILQNSAPKSHLFNLEKLDNDLFSQFSNPISESSCTLL
jgi:hypothetical protein